MRTAHESDFYVDVEGIGRFRFGRRSYGDRLKIRAEFARLTKSYVEYDEKGDEILDVDVAGMASVISAYKTLMVECPAGWEDMEAVDILAVPDVEIQSFRIYAALKAKEDSFRPQAKPAREAVGEGNAPDHGVLVPAVLPPVAEGSAIPGTNA